MIANHMKPVLFAAALAAAFASAVEARDRWPEGGGSRPGYHGGHHYGYGHHGRRGDLKILNARVLGNPARAVAAGPDLQRNQGSIVTTGSSGVVSGSTMFYVDGGRIIYSGDGMAPPATEKPYLAPKAKIIDVTEELAQGSFKPVDGCSYEMGVCVIRGDK
ncbi:hypothetical protein [Neorhizobium sp. NCHU2750]|uniref:hypothetical protein n=1 Tax=Neorhizobium sp. NCHU2750 TaxID=1825976 RepID=UPI000E70F60A|nr:hypothetical protein NCHU2750_34290 [Neorhizobium sp. NCHU2750]